MRGKAWLGPRVTAKGIVITAIPVLALVGIVAFIIHTRREQELAAARREAAAQATACIERGIKSQADRSLKWAKIRVRRRCASAISAVYELKCPDQPSRCEDEADDQISAWLDQEWQRAQRRRARIEKLEAQKKRGAEIDAALADLEHQKGITRDEVKERLREEIEEEAKGQEAASPDD
ncbi:hypothetical protein [Heyndrickxia sporothermodurans]